MRRDLRSSNSLAHGWTDNSSYSSSSFFEKQKKQNKIKQNLPIFPLILTEDAYGPQKVNGCWSGFLGRRERSFLLKFDGVTKQPISEPIPPKASNVP